MTRADSDPRGEIQSDPDAACGWESLCIEAPSMRTAPTPTPVASAAASAWRRVTPRRTGSGAEFARSTADSTLTPQFNRRV